MKIALGIGSMVVGLLVGGAWLSQSLQNDGSGVISQNGIHWHPTLAIYVKGEKLEIPQNIGLTAAHLPVHTHDDLPRIHLEFSGAVKTDDVMLGQFFRSWGKDMRSFGTNMRMTVNGEENTEYGNYVMRDGDRIELNYE